jgi:hypothetical protein
MEEKGWLASRTLFLARSRLVEVQIIKAQKARKALQYLSLLPILEPPLTMDPQWKMKKVC